jgi:hypothetical protein
MPISFVAADDRAVFNPGSSIATNAGVNIAVGDLVAVLLHYPISSATVTVADDATTPNTYTVLAQGGGNSGYDRIAYSEVTTAKTGAIITATFGTGQTDTTDICAMVFSKSAGTAWNADGGATGAASFATTVASGNYTTTYDDGVSVAIGHTTTTETWTPTLNNAAVTLAPNPNTTVQSVFFYQTHGKVTNQHADVTMAASHWVSCRFYSFGTSASGGAYPTGPFPTFRPDLP